MKGVGDNIKGNELEKLMRMGVGDHGDDMCCGKESRNRDPT
jgi:hypothetical protein